ncbi:hypothetical protein AC630_24055 [Bradyrhizobium sp. AS23.2]|nr:hypothetical protein AC630_24055 [Bradyrhizobium sp. AS23.2]
MVCQKQGAAPRSAPVKSAQQKSFVRQDHCADEAVCLSRGREKRRDADFKQEAGGTAQSFRDQD